jgi:hypothetical protein
VARVRLRARPGHRHGHAHAAYQLHMLKDAMGVQDYAVYNAFAVLSVLPLLTV